MEIKVKGILETYVKDGDTKYSIGRAKCVDAPKPTAQAQGGGSQSNGDKNRSFAMSYAKDLVVAGRVPIDELRAKANVILEWLEGKVPVAKGGDPNPEYSENPEPVDEGSDIPF